MLPKGDPFIREMPLTSSGTWSRAALDISAVQWDGRNLLYLLGFPITSRFYTWSEIPSQEKLCYYKAPNDALQKRQNFRQTRENYFAFKALWNSLNPTWNACLLCWPFRGRKGLDLLSRLKHLETKVKQATWGLVIQGLWIWISGQLQQVWLSSVMSDRFSQIWEMGSDSCTGDSRGQLQTVRKG